MAETPDRVEVVAGDKRAVFVRGEAGWTPDWFYQGGRRMLRFKDHQWLSIGHVHPDAASDAERLPAGGAVFRGRSLYGQTPVAWSVTVAPDEGGEGFVVDCELTPEASIELLEAYSAFESPYEYDGTETVTTVIGMNPVVRWKGKQRLSPPVWEHPAWLYSRPQSARCTGPCNAPLLCQAITDAGSVEDRFITVVGDWTVCRVHDVYVCPTRTTANDPGAVWGHPAPTRGYKYLVGALNWSSAFAKDPNVLFEGGRAHRQRVVVDFDGRLPGGTLDAMLCRAWQRAAAFEIPADGRVEAFDRATRRGVTWRAAVTWLRDVFCSDAATEDLYKPGEGICTYATGSRPKAGGGYTFHWWTQWAGPLHYRARMTGDEALRAACDRIDRDFAENAARLAYFDNIAASVSMLPTVWWVRGGGRGGLLHEALRPLLEHTLEKSRAENGRTRQMDYGSQASIAEALLLGAEAYDAPAMRKQALVLLEEMAERLDGNFWEFNCGQAGSLAHGGQIRSLGHGHAVMANLLAWRHGRDERFLLAARRFARFLLAVNYACHNGSADPDFDWRGWCNGSNAGRDQIAEFPPWETQNGLTCIAALAGEADLEEGFYDALWYIARTGLAQFPAARTVKRILDQEMRVHYVPREQLASERDFYDRWPYLAYENPHDQTLLASYQGTDCILGELVYGHGCARPADDRLSVLVPRAATMDLRELAERDMRVWNPTPAAIDTTVEVTWPDGSTKAVPVSAPPRELVKLTVRK